MEPQALDHIALHVSEPERLADELLGRLPFKIIEQTDEFVLIGRSATLGKLTLFRASGPRERGSLARIGIGIPCAAISTEFELEDELVVELVPGPAEGEVDLDHVVLVVADPVVSARAWLRFGFSPEPQIEGVERVHLGTFTVEFRPGTPKATDRPLLNHLGLLVESFDEASRAASDLHLHVTREVDAESSRALFVQGPDGVELEYIEHKPSFALA